MTTYIAHFSARHRLIQIRQNSIFTWQQDSGEVDRALPAGPNFPVNPEDIAVAVHLAQPFPG